MIVETIRNLLTKRRASDIIKHKSMFDYRQTNLRREECVKGMDVRNVANYVIQEYLKCRVKGQKVACTRTKIGKLLTIIQILSIKCRRKLAFDDTIVTEACGTSVPILSVYRYPYDIWELGTDISLKQITFSTQTAQNSYFEFFEENSSIDCSKMTEIDEQIPKLYEIQEGEDIDESLKKIIRDVFIEFGTYDSYEIGKMINEFKERICVDDIVDENKVIKWLHEIQIQQTEINKLIKFISKYDIDS